MIMLTIYMFFLCLLYFDLIIQMTYDIVCFIIGKSTGGTTGFVPINDTTQLIFSKFSQQWMTLIMMFPILGMLFMKDMSILVKIGKPR